MTVLTGYVAFTEAGGRAAEQRGRLLPKNFGKPFEYVPFDSTAPAAVDRALKQIVPQAAIAPTSWFILKVELTAEQTCEAFKSGLIVALGSNGWRYYGNVDLKGSIAIDWFMLVQAPLGVMKWAEKALSCKCRMLAEGTCKECGATSVTWAGWCASCWNRFRIEHDDDADEPTVSEPMVPKQID